MQFKLDAPRCELRKRRLRRGANAFQLECESLGLPRRGVTMLTLTVRDPDASLDGRIRAFWHAVRNRWGKQLYFSWPELQKRGVIHYHGVLVDGPGPREGLTKEWLAAAWPEGFSWAHFEKAHRVKANVLGDAVAYAKKMGWKEYQQAYDTFPKGLRSFQTSRLTTPVARLAMRVPLIVELLDRIGLGLVSAATKVGPSAWRFAATLRGARAPPRMVTAKVLVTIDRALKQGTLWGFQLEKGEAFAAA